MSETHRAKTEIPKMIGEIVLSTQEAEKYMKLISPFFEVNKNTDLGAVLKQYKKEKKKTFGELVGKFLDSSTLSPVEFSRHLKGLVKRRNRVVHHFHDCYGKDLASGKSRQVIATLREQLVDVNAFRDMLGAITLTLLEEMRDTIFQGESQYKDMEQICNALRQRFPVIRSPELVGRISEA